MEAPPGFEPGMEVLQTSACPRFRPEFAILLSNLPPDSPLVPPESALNG